MLERLARSINNLGFSQIIHKTASDPIWVYVAFRRGQQVYWSCNDLEDPFFTIDCVQGRQTP